VKITIASKQNGSALALLPVVAVFVIFLVVIGIIVYLMVKTIQKIAPPPPDPDTRLAIGDPYDGGTVVGWTNPPVIVAASSPSAVKTEAVQTGQSGTVDIFGGDTPSTATNWIWSGLLTDMQTNANGLPVEQWTNGMPPVRFYQFHYNP
jgi:hypothetical protein